MERALADLECFMRAGEVASTSDDRPSGHGNGRACGHRGALFFVRLGRSWVSRTSCRGPLAMLSLLHEEACECTDQVDAAERLAEEELPLWVDLQSHDL